MENLAWYENQAHLPSVVVVEAALTEAVEVCILTKNIL